MVQGLITEVASPDMTPRSKGQGDTCTLFLWLRLMLSIAQNVSFIDTMFLFTSPEVLHWLADSHAVTVNVQRCCLHRHALQHVR